MPKDKPTEERATVSGSNLEQKSAEEQKETMTSEELESSTHPKAPEKPLEPPPTPSPVEEAADDTKPAPLGEEPTSEAVKTEQPKE